MHASSVHPNGRLEVADVPLPPLIGGEIDRDAPPLAGAFVSEGLVLLPVLLVEGDRLPLSEALASDELGVLPGLEELD